MTTFRYREARPSDGLFLSIGAREAERCHTGIGIFDLVLRKSAEEIELQDREREDGVSKYIMHAILNDPTAHIYYANFIVAEHVESGELAGCACAFPYPEFGVFKSIPAFQNGLKATAGCSEDEAKAAFDAWDFLNDAFPDVEYDHTWAVESVYVHPKYRRHGLGEQLVKRCMEAMATKHKGVDSRRFLITCAVGNEGARRLYERVGFRLVGQGESEQCMAAIRCSGFYVLST